MQPYVTKAEIEQRLSVPLECDRRRVVSLESTDDFLLFMSETVLPRRISTLQEAQLVSVRAFECVDICGTL